MDAVPPTHKRILVFAARGALVLSLFAYIMLALAEQGGGGTELEPVPPSPLPFDRSGVFGLDLSELSSVDAVEWLGQADTNSLPLVVVPVDGDITVALADDSQAEEGANAFSSLLDRFSGSALAVCFHRPISSQEPEALAERAIGFLQDNYSNRVAYVASCSRESQHEWQQVLAGELGLEQEIVRGRLMPLSVGAPVELQPVDDRSDLERSHLQTFSGNEYVLPILSANQPIQPATQDLARTAITNAAQIGLVLVRPASTVNANDLVATMSAARLDLALLPHGFTAVTSPAVRTTDGWQTTSIGTVEYRRTDQAGAMIAVDFIGSGLYVVGLSSPAGGEAEVWIDETPGAAAEPDQIIDFQATQSRNTAIVAAGSLPTGQHQVTLVIRDGETSISGFFVQGNSATRWNSGLASVGLIVLAAGSLTFLSLRRVAIIRARTRPSGNLDAGPHPREFTRDG